MNLAEFRETLHLPPDHQDSPHQLKTCTILGGAVTDLIGHKGIIIGQRFSNTSGPGKGEIVQSIALTPPWRPSKHWSPIAVLGLPLKDINLGPITKDITP